MNSIDLNITNYSLEDLRRFFTLPKNYTENDLENKEKEYIVSIVSANGLDSQKKYDLIMFLKAGRQTLFNELQKRNSPDMSSQEPRAQSLSKSLNMNANNVTVDNSTLRFNLPGNAQQSSQQQGSHNKEENPVLNKYEQVQIGSILNPGSHAPSMQFQRNALPYSTYANGYGNNTIVRNYVFNTLFRDDFFQTVSTNCSFTLTEKMTNVISVDLSALQFPNFYFTFSGTKRTNSMFFLEDETGNFAMVRIPNGNYDATTFPPVFEQCINEQVVGYYDPSGNNRFHVSIDPYTYYTTISNTTYNFSMVMNSSANADNHSETYVCQLVLQTRYFKTEPDPKFGIRPEQYFQSLAWLIGYRDIIYTGSNSYTSEGHFDNTLSNYVYFLMKDFVNNQIESTYGVLPGSILSKDILAVVPVTTNFFTSTFDNNANFIYKTRVYTGPVNISKIGVQLCNPYGEPISLHSSDYAFCLQVTSIKDPKLFSSMDAQIANA